MALFQRRNPNVPQKQTLEESKTIAQDINSSDAEIKAAHKNSCSIEYTNSNAIRIQTASS